MRSRLVQNGKVLLLSEEVGETRQKEEQAQEPCCSYSPTNDTQKGLIHHDGHKSKEVRLKEYVQLNRHPLSFRNDQ